MPRFPIRVRVKRLKSHIGPRTDLVRKARIETTAQLMREVGR